MQAGEHKYAARQTRITGCIVVVHAMRSARGDEQRLRDLTPSVRREGGCTNEQQMRAHRGGRCSKSPSVERFGGDVQEPMRMPVHGAGSSTVRDDSKLCSL